MPELAIGRLGFWAGLPTPPTAINTEGGPRIPALLARRAEHRSSLLCPAAVWPPSFGGAQSSHGLHRAGPRGRPRAVPGAAPAVGGGRRRGDPERERRLGSLLRLLRGPSQERAAGRGGEAAAGGQRPRARPHPERQHGLHRPAHPHPHRAGGPQALQDRDPPPGLQLHLAPGQRAAAGRGLPGRAALLPSPPRGQGRRGHGRAAPAQHLHLLPEQPAQRGGKSEGAGWEQLSEGQSREPGEDASEVSPGQLSVGEGQPKGDP